MTDTPDDATRVGLPPGIGKPGPTSWHRLDPLTRLTISLATLVAVVALGGVVGPLLLGVVAVLVPALVAGVLGRLTRLTLLVALPLALSAALVNVLFTPGGADVVAELGTHQGDGRGLRVAAEVVVRVVVMGAAVSLFYLTTRPAELVASLQAHGLSARAAFVVHDAVAIIPRLAERSAEVAAAQRARGLDSEGGLGRRLRGLLAVAAPTVSGAIAEAETRALALESRGFSRPGRRTLLWVPADSAAQRLARWGLLASLVVLVLLRLAGWAAVVVTRRC